MIDWNQVLLLLIEVGVEVEVELGVGVGGGGVVDPSRRPRPAGKCKTCLFGLYVSTCHALGRYRPDLVDAVSHLGTSFGVIWV